MRIDSSLILSLSVVLAVACGDDGSSTSTSDNNTTGTTDTGNPATTDPGTTNPGTTDPGTTDPGTTDPATDSGSEGDSTAGDTTGGDSTDGDSSGSSGSSGGEESSSSGGMVMPVNGCTIDTAMDMTGQDEVVISDIQAWTVVHQVCVIVSPGTDVIWNGNLTFHPIVGGETPAVDAGSPITALGANSGKTATFTAPDGEGEYPYFCDVHLASMQGVIYVMP